MRALIVVNPNATTTTARALDVLLSALRHDLELEVAETAHRGHATGLAAEARREGVDLIVALGGDGTVNEIVNGVLTVPGTTPVPDLAVVPGGSTNVLARNLGIPADPVEATGMLLDAVRSGRRRVIGLGRIDGRYFTFCAGMGLDAEVIRAVEARRADGARASVPLYLRTAVERYFAQPGRRRGGPVTLERPGAAPIGGLSLVLVANCSPWTYVGRRPVHPTPLASFDADLDVLAMSRMPLTGTLGQVAGLLRPGRKPGGRHVRILHDVPSLVLSSVTPMPVQVDGDYLGARTRIELVSVPAALRVLVSSPGGGL